MKSGQVRSSIADVAAGAKSNGILEWLRAPGSRWQRICRLGETGGTAILLVCVGLFLFRSRHWPLVNDPALMHYVVFLMERGMAPYREIGDINLPGAYAPEWVSMSLAQMLHVSEAAMWRLMDALALLLAGWAMVRIARPYSWFAGVWAGALLALYHCRDGIGQAGQRDLWTAMLLLWAVSFLFGAMGQLRVRVQSWQVFGFGLCAGAAVTVKPFGAFFLILLVPILLWKRSMRLLLCAGAGVALPLFAALLFVNHWHAAAGLWRVLTVELPYHARLGDRTVWQLLPVSTLPSVAKLLLVLSVVLVISGGWRTALRGPAVRPGSGASWTVAPQRALLAGCVLLGLLSFLLQGKGYPYHRYPYVAFLLLFLGLEFAHAVRSEKTVLRITGAAGFAFGVLFCAPSYLQAAAKAHWSIPMMQAMEEAIDMQAGGNARSLDGRVQCLDVVSGCTDALLHLGLRESTGTIYDEFLFPQTPSGWGVPYGGPQPGAPLAPAVLGGRQRFQAELLLRSPQVFIVSAWLFPQGPGEYRKLALWPWFDAYLREHYTLVAQQEFARAENGPLGFRVYVRRGSALH